MVRNNHSYNPEGRPAIRLPSGIKRLSRRGTRVREATFWPDAVMLASCHGVNISGERSRNRERSLQAAR